MGKTHFTLAFFIFLFRSFAIVALPYSEIKNSYDELKQIYGKVNHDIDDSLKLTLSIDFLKKFGKSFESLHNKLNGGDRHFRDVYKIYFNSFGSMQSNYRIPKLQS